MERKKKFIGKTYPIVYEGFTDCEFSVSEAMRPWKEPACGGSTGASVVKFRVTIEKIEEPIEIYIQRLRKLWLFSDNHHHREHIQREAKSLGIETAVLGRFGSENKKVK